MTRRLMVPLVALALSALAGTGCGLVGGDDPPTPTATLAAQQAVTSPTQSAVPTSPAAPTMSPTPAGPSTYVVEAGDNPTLIAEKLGVPEDETDTWVEEMLALNGTEATFLQIGQELILPPIGGPPAVVTMPEVQATTQPNEAATTTPTATETPGAGATAAPSPSVPPGGSFTDGIRTVGLDVFPGTYRTRQPSVFCYWARLSGFGGADADIIADSVDENGVSVVTILASDAGFESDGCGTWTNDLSAVTSSPQSPFSDGTYIVGTDIAPGTWRTESAGETCYWERTSGFGASLEEVIDSDVEGPVVQIVASDAGFYTAGCGTWTYVP